jgi:subtilisin family serine protease
MHSRSTTAVALAFACLVSNAAAEATEDVSRFGWVVSAREVPTVATGMRRRWFLDGLDKDARAMRTSCAASGLDHVWLLESDDSSSAARAGRSLASDPDVEWIEPLQRRAPADLAAGPPAGFESIGFPNDPLFVDGRQWGLDNRGAAGVYGGVEGADIRAVQAWSMSRGDPSVRLAIADTGIDPHHPDLAMETPRGPRIELGINVTTDPSGSWADSAGHGTAVAGVMAARTGDGAALDSLGMAGVCGGDGGDNAGCRIVPIKITSGHATAATSFDVARAIVYAVTAGARAVNVSFAGTGTSRLERLALSYAIERGCLVVAASGNRGASAGTQPQYPAAYAADGLCLQVGASDVWDRRAVFSSYGPGLDVVAPGVDIWTTFPTYPSAAGATYPGYVSVSGTSFAAPFATGVAGLLAARR